MLAVLIVLAITRSRTRGETAGGTSARPPWPSGTGTRTDLDREPPDDHDDQPDQRGEDPHSPPSWPTLEATIPKTANGTRATTQSKTFIKSSKPIVSRVDDHTERFFTA